MSKKYIPNHHIDAFTERRFITPLLKCISLLLLSFGMVAGSVAAPLDQYNIVWESQSEDSEASMPLSGGVLALNVWVQDNDLLILMGSPNSLHGAGLPIKLGLLRLQLGTDAFAQDFRQELNLAKSEITVTGKTTDGQEVTVRLWCDVFEPIIHVGMEAAKPVDATISYETWEHFKAKVVDGGLQFVKRLAPINKARMEAIEAQGLAEIEESVPDPLSNLTMGGRIIAPGMLLTETAQSVFNGRELRTLSLKTEKPVTDLDLQIVIRMEQDATLEEWEAKLAATPIGSRDATLAWWDDFWNRSHIITNPGAGPDDKIWQAGRNYQLIRYILAANRGGRTMTLFNGGLFTASGNPDRRKWSRCQYMGQNQMHVYWPMLRSGDFDLLKVGTDFYKERTPMRRLYAKAFWDVEGVTFPEPFSIFGLSTFGTDEEGRVEKGHLKYHYTSGMTFALMMLKHDAYTGTQTPGYEDTALGIIRYYDNYYQKKLKSETGKPLDENGKLVIYPSGALETYHGCTNNTDVLAGLKALIRDLLATPPSVLSDEERAYLIGFKDRIADFTFEEENGRKFYAIADKEPEWAVTNPDQEFPQMYITYPFDAVSLGRSDMELVKNTWELGAFNTVAQHQNQCWYANAIYLARMGKTALAAEYTIGKLLHTSLRFPAFYTTLNYIGKSFCHDPDTDHSGIAMTAFQEMLMQTDGKRILVGPSWPANWDCDFKLHAPYQTTVEGRVADGKVIITKVTPASREADIEIFPLTPIASDFTTPISEGKTATASSDAGLGYTPNKAFDGDIGTRWCAKRGQVSGTLEVDLGAPTEISRAEINEIGHRQVKKFAVEAQMADGTWKTLVEGGDIGPIKVLTFTPVEAQKFRLNIHESTLINTSYGVNINEFKLYEKKGL